MGLASDLLRGATERGQVHSVVALGGKPRIDRKTRIAKLPNPRLPGNPRF